MAAAQAQLDRDQQRQHARFQRMGLSARVMPGGRCLLVSLPMSPAPLETLSGSIVLERVVFSTVGASQIKCLRPRSVFGLPLIDISRCADPVAIETAIRRTWLDRMRELRDTGRRLADIGIEAEPVEGSSVLAFSLSGESPEARVMMHRPSEAMLPSTGPLSGITLDALGQRVIDVSGSLESATDLECFLGDRLEVLAREAVQQETHARREARLARPPMAPRTKPRDTLEPSLRHRPKVLLVGSKVIENAALRAALDAQGFRMAIARSETEALVRLASMTPDVVISEYGLGRSDGASLVQATLSVAGIERIPVVLLDDSNHASRREAARAVGAAGYVIEPLSLERFVPRIGQLVEKPPKRRFTRYPRRLAARFTGSTGACLATEVGRGGVFISTTSQIDDGEAMECEIALPELDRRLRFGGEVLYRNELQGSDRKGFGLRFAEISAEDEASLIEYLTWIEASR